MVDSNQHFEAFQPHTLLKHAFWRSYLGRWAHILLWNQPRRTKLRVVDACAGEGTDGAGNPGSPLIAIEEAEKARANVLSQQARQVSVEVFAIEQNLGRFRKLSAAVRSAGGPHMAVRGTLADAMKRFEPEFSDIPTLFFIDPFGLEPLRGDLVRRALAGDRNEVFLLFADQAALRHVGVMRKMAADETSAQSSLFDDLNQDEPSALASDPHLKRTAEASEEILDAAFDKLDWRRVLGLPSAKRRQALLDLYSKFLHSAGASHVLRIPIIDERTHLKYHLVHASKHGFAYRVMKEAIEAGWRKGLVGESAVRLMRLGVDCRVEDVVRRIQVRFAGREIQWETEVRGASDLKRYVLEETPAMPAQTKDIRQQLKPFAISGRRGWYKFPNGQSDQNRR